jgi:hypothetical protein
LLGTKDHARFNLGYWKNSRLKTRLYALRETIYQTDIADILLYKENKHKQVKMVVLKELAHLTPKNLPNYCGYPLHQRSVFNGTLWSCRDNWAAWVADEKVKEVWVMKNVKGP